MWAFGVAAAAAAAAAPPEGVSSFSFSGFSSMTATALLAAPVGCALLPSPAGVESGSQA